MQTLAFLPNLGWVEMLVIGLVMLLLFGRRLPEVGRSLGQGIVSFKKGLKDVEDEVNVYSTQSQSPQFESAKAPDHPEREQVAHGSSSPSPASGKSPEAS